MRSPMRKTAAGHAYRRHATSGWPGRDTGPAGDPCRDLTSDCLSVMPGGTQSHASLAASHPLDQDAIARGISLLTLYQDSVRNDPETHAYARWLTELGGQVRTAPVLPPRMLIFDRTVGVIPIDPTNGGLGALCTSEPGFVIWLITVFDQAWSTAIPLGADVEADIQTSLSPIDRALLKLLATGVTDEAAGRISGSRRGPYADKWQP